MQTKASVSPRSTKQDIWDAYQELLNEMQQGLPSPTVVKKFQATNSQLKEQLTTLITDIGTVLQNKLKEVNAQFDEAVQLLDQLHHLHSTQTQNLGQEKAEALKARKREEEEYAYEFEKLKKRQTEDLAEQRQKMEAELSDKKAELKLQEDELKELRQKVATFDAELNKAVKEAIAKTTEDLTREFNHQKALFEQETKATTQLLQQKVDSLEVTIRNYQEEITHLQTSLKEANQQLTRIAERAVEKGPQPFLPSKE